MYKLDYKIIKIGYLAFIKCVKVKILDLIRNKTLEEKIGARTNAKGLYDYAEIYWRSFREISNLSGGTARYYPADYFLAARSIELSLKCILRAHGTTLDDLSYKFGHDLKKITKYISKKNNVVFSEKQKEVIRIINRSYKLKQFEYKVIGTKVLPKEVDLEEVCTTLLEKARPFAEKDNSFREYLIKNKL